MIGRACPNYKHCMNNSDCMNCDGTSLLKLDKKEFKQPTKKRGGQKTEKKVIKRTNNVIKKKIEMAYSKKSNKLTPNSGAGHIKGDGITVDLMQEMKERNHRLTGGNKSISIQREWLDKLEKEAYQANKQYYILPFTFGENEDKIYAITDYDVQLQIYGDIVYLKQVVESQKEEIEKLNSIIESLQEGE